MNSAEIIIIYLALGAPFGVYRATANEPAPFASRPVIFLAALFAWPVFLVQVLAEHLLTALNRQDDRTENLRLKIEQIAFCEAEIQSVFEFREVFQRFVGLAASSRPEELTPQSPLFEITAHNDQALANVCLARSNRARLLRHLERSKDEFVSTIRQLSSSAPESEELIGLAVELGKYLGIAITAAEFSRQIPEAFENSSAEEQIDSQIFEAAA